MNEIAIRPLTLPYLQGPCISEKSPEIVEQTPLTSPIGLTETATSSLLEANPISFLKLYEPQLFRNKRILIVDDLLFALERAKNIVEKNFKKAIRGKSDGLVKVFAREITDNDLALKIDGKRFIEIVIEDNGCGMPPEKVNEINERRCKENGSTFGTLGWGLPILQDFMAQAGGVYQAESTIGQGTKFKLYFKLN